jgi:5-methylcytosine-specific restriction endonuclease McrA
MQSEAIGITSRGTGLERMRKATLIRDRHTCRICKKEDGEISMHVHHIDWNRMNNTDENLVTLCSRCHHAVHLERYKPEEHPDYPVPWGNIIMAIDEYEGA